MIFPLTPLSSLQPRLEISQSLTTALAERINLNEKLIMLDTLGGGGGGKGGQMGGNSEIHSM